MTRSEPQPPHQRSTGPDPGELPVFGSPPPVVCAVLSYYAANRTLSMGCPPTPPPVDGPRPCALARAEEPVSLLWDDQGRLTRAGDLELTYDARGQLARTVRPFLRGTLQTEAISAGPELVEWRTRLQLPAYNAGEGEVVQEVRESYTRISLEEGAVTRVEVTAMRSDGPVLISDQRIRRLPGRIEARDVVTGDRSVAELDAAGRLLSFTVTPADDPEVPDDLEEPARLSFEWTGPRWTLFVEAGVHAPIEYECAE